MSFHGSLTDLPIVDVLQLLNATRKTGTLNVVGPHGEAALTLREGLIVSVTHPNKKINIGSVLVGMGITSPGDIEKALEQQNQPGVERKPILTILIESNLIEKNLAFKGLERLIEMAIGEVIKWKEGTFTLDSDSVAIHDDFRFSPNQLVTDASELKVDTQQVLLNALRTLDESELNTLIDKKNLVVNANAASQSPPPPPAKSEKGIRPEEIDDHILGLDQIDHLHPFRHEKQVGVPLANPPVFEKFIFLFSTDFTLQEALKKSAADHHLGFSAFSEFKDLTERLTDTRATHPRCFVILDVGPLAEGIDSQHSLDLAKNLLSRFPRAPLGFLYPSDNFMFTASLPSLGGIPALNKPTQISADVLPDFLDAFFLFIENMGKSSRTQNEPIALNKQITELIRQKSGDDVSGSLLRFLSEIFRRIVLFGIKRDEILAVNTLGTPVSINNFSLLIPQNSLFAQVMEKTEAYWGPPDSFIQETIFTKISPPKETDIFLLPLKAQSRMIALVYADFGDHSLKPFSTHSFEILAAFAGLLLENSLFEKQIQKFSKTQP